MDKHTGYWSPLKRIAFRFSFTFFALHLLPLSSAFWQHVYAQQGDVFFTTFAGANYFPSFFGDWGHYDIKDFILISGLSLLIALGWTLAERKADSYTTLYHVTRLVLRYKLAAVLLTYAIIKIFPLQLPEPTLSDLNTEYGDFTRARIFELTVGVAKAHYQTAIGLTELLAAALLFFRRTATIGAIIASGTLLNVVLAAFAYRTGAEFYSLYLMLITLFLIAHDLPGMYSLLIEKRAVPNDTALTLSKPLAKVRPLLKGAFIVVALVYAAAVYGSSERSYLLPQSPGLNHAAGLYDVSEFRLNGILLPYSKADPDRWQDVVFEKWNTISISKAAKPKVENKPVVIGAANDNRRWESSASGGRHYYSYATGGKQPLLLLKNKNSRHAGEHMTLRYSRPDRATIILAGRSSSGDSIYAVLKKIEKQYLLIKGRRKPVTL